jgi:hypothetical protein
MIHAKSLRTQVVRIFRSRGYLDGSPMANFNPKPLQFPNLRGVIRNQVDGLYSQIANHQGCGGVITFIGLMPQLQIRFNCIKTRILEIVGSKLVHEADAPALLSEVEQHTALRVPDHLEGAFQLLAAVAPQGAEDITCEALRVDPYQQILCAANVPKHESQMLLGILVVLVHDQAKLPLVGRHTRTNSRFHLEPAHRSLLFMSLVQSAAISAARKDCIS